MGKGRKAQPVQPGPPSKPLPAQGTGQQKRTPNSAFDAAAGNDIYEPEMVVGERQKNLGGGKYETQYEVKWKGYEKKHNTYEPLSNLAGCEDMVAEYKERKRQRDAELEAEEREKKRQKQEDADAERKRLAAAEAAARVARQQGAEGAEGAPAVATDATDASGANAPGPDKKTRRSAPCWEVFTETGAKDGYAFCTLTHPKKISQLCNEEICTKYGPTGMRNHLQYVHPDQFIRLYGAGEPLGKAVAQPGVLAVSSEMRDKLHKAHARWLVKRKRPLSLTEDPEYRDIWTHALHGAYTPPDHKTVRSHMLQLSAEGRGRLVTINTALREAGIKPCAAGDIWSDRGVSLLGICEYYINEGWEIIELVRPLPARAARCRPAGRRPADGLERQSPAPMRPATYPPPH